MTRRTSDGRGDLPPGLHQGAGRQGRETGEGYSIPTQREACLRYIAERGWNLAGEFTDAGESARTADRPMLKELLRRVAEGGIGVVVVHKIDRLAARSMEDHVAIRAALRHVGVQLVSVTENIEETASGRLVEGIHALMAEFSRPTWPARSERA
jgi:site-specific DNA recombinase